MIRRVAFKKAILAGAFGALAWDLLVRLLILLRLPFFDLVYVLGTMIFAPENHFLIWWTAGILMHALVGSLWTIFYAYFFWALFDRKPFVQGALFSLLPAVLAGSIMIPQMDFMLDGGDPAGSSQAGSRYGFFASGIGWGGPFAVIFGHLVYGVVMGAIYTKPVGYAAGKQVKYG
jgi:hypothetical protein